jgi:hypothetical protein
MKKRYWYYLIFLGFTITLLTLVLIARSISFEKRVEANILIVEGWMPEFNLFQALTEFKRGKYELMLITGGELDEQITLFYNSYLILYPRKHIKNGVDFLEIQAKNTLGKGDSAHFVVWINNQAVEDYYTTKSGGIFRIELSTEKVDSIMIQFDNDKVTKKGDRNLLVERVFFNNENLLAEGYDIYIDRGNPFGRHRRNFAAISYAERAANYFVDMGLPEDKIIPVTNHYSNLRRTYGNALALKKWIAKRNADTSNIEGINIFTLDYHSRRTWLTYRRFLKEFDIKTGVIPADDNLHKQSKRLYYLRATKESVSLFYYMLFVFPWMK